MTGTTTQQSIPNGVWTKLLSGPVSVYQDSGANSWVEDSGDHLTFAPLPNGQWRVRVGDMPQRVEFGVFYQATNQRRFGSVTLKVGDQSWDIPAKETRVVGPFPQGTKWSATGALGMRRGVFFDGEFVGEDLP